MNTAEAGGPRGYDTGKKIKGRKRHIVTDTLDNMLEGVVHGYRRIAVLNRQLSNEGLEPVNHKRVYRVMAVNRLLLARRYTERLDCGHDGVVVAIRSNLRWCSDGFEFGCWNGEVVRGAFVIDAHDREIIAWRGVTNAGISEMCGTSCWKRRRPASAAYGPHRRSRCCLTAA